MFPCIDISHAMLRRAVVRSINMGTLKRSFMQGDRNIIGLVGEELYSTLVPEAQHQDTYDYDFMLRGLRVDVKTRIVTKEPAKDWEMAILLTRPDQNVDFYVFAAAHNTFTKGWLLGFLSKRDFLAKSLFQPSGSPMPQGGNYRSDSWIIQIKDMQSIQPTLVNKKPKNRC